MSHQYGYVAGSVLLIEHLELSKWDFGYSVPQLIEEFGTIVPAPSLLSISV